LTIALTATVPVECGGESIVQRVVEAQLTFLADFPPNVKAVPDVPGTKPAASTVTSVAPPVAPSVGADGMNLRCDLLEDRRANAGFQKPSSEDPRWRRTLAVTFARRPCRSPRRSRRA